MGMWQVSPTPFLSLTHNFSVFYVEGQVYSTILFFICLHCGDLYLLASFHETLYRYVAHVKTKSF